MLTKKEKKCSNCSKSIYDYEEVCPFCNENLNKNNKVIKYVTGKIYFSNLKEIIIFVVGFIFLDLFALLLSFIVNNTVFQNQIIDEESYDYYFRSYLINIISYSVLLLALLGIINKDIRLFSKSFKNKLSFLGIPFGIVMMILYISYSIIISVLLPEFSKSANEVGLDSTQTLFPIGMFFLIVFLGPICEEIIYRAGLYSLLRKKNKFLAVFVSSFAFAFIHIFSTILHYTFDPRQINLDVLLNDLLNLPVYLIMGISLGLIYEFFGFAGSLYAHILNNLLGFLGSLSSTIVLLI